MDSPSRADFYDNLGPNGKYSNIVAIYRENSSANRIGIFDAELISKLPNTTKWIAHNGAGYDQIDVVACKVRGSSNL
jgi:glyoxylate reductase